MRIVRGLCGLVTATIMMLTLGVASAQPSSPVAASAGPRSPAQPSSPAVAASMVETARYPQKGDTSIAVFRLQQRLLRAKELDAKAMTGHYNVATVAAVTRFQRSQHLHGSGKLNLATWSALVRLTGATPKVVVPTLDRRCLTSSRAICVDKTLRKLYYVKNSSVLQIMDTRFGCRSTPTREGRFRIVRKSRNHTSSIYHVYMPYAMFFHGGQAVHWSKAFTKHGYHGCSHGCVNIRNKAGVRWLFDQMRVHDRVVIYRS